MVDSDIIGILIWSVEGQILEANDAFLRMVQYDRQDLASGRIRWKDLTPPEWNNYDAQAIEDVKRTGTTRTFEKEYFRKDGSRVPVLVGGATFEEDGSQGVAFVLDLTEQKRAEGERKRAEEAVNRAQAELAHIARVATMGELTASIAHEINQPLGAVVNNASACLRWLAAKDLEEARRSASLVIAEGHRAGEIIGRVRALAKKTPPQKGWVDINETIREVVALTRSEVQRNGVLLQTQFANDLPLIMGDRIQLQQVILNLLINGIEAMAGLDEGQRALWVSSQKIGQTSDELVEHAFEDEAAAQAEQSNLLIAVRDSGPGLDPANFDRLFDPFYTTKPQGLGMGLAISRSIIEAHGGRLWVTPNTPSGAVFQFTLPISGDRMS